MEYTLQAIKYNNYYNRQLKIADDYTDVDPNPYWEEGIYFNFSDGVNTTQVVDDLVEDKDYCILYELGGLASLNSRWFIIDAEYQLNGQTVLTLRRDLLADFAPEVLYATAFIEKGWLQANNNLIFNTEQMTFNQVKKEEFLLKDSTNIPWIVGYYPNDATITGTAKLANTEYDFAIDNNYADWYYKGSKTVQPLPDTVQYKFFIWSKTSTEYTLRKGTNGDTVTTDNKAAGNNWIGMIPDTSVNEIQRGLYYGLHREDYYKYLLQEDGVSNITAQELLAFNNKTIRFNDGVYKISVYPISGTSVTNNASLGKNLSTNMLEDIKGIFPSKNVTNHNINLPWLEYSYQAQIYTVQGNKASTGTYTYSIKNTHYTLSDSPYSMFCMPHGGLTVTEGSTSIRTSADIQLAVAMDMAKANGQMYDVQILPYCPLSDIVGGAYTVTDNRAYDQIKEGETVVGYIFHCQRASFSKRLSLASGGGSVPDWTIAKSNSVDVKVQNECEFIRFNSPNYASSWEMSVAKNNGISYVNVSATYKPFSPYIKVYPDFKGLYGNDFNDQRGLILAGDFSIPVVTDQWKTYELQNKNYQSIFDREIRNLDIQQSYSRRADVIGTVTGALGAAGTGMALGAAAGPVGMGVGAAVGGLLSAGAGIADVYINDKLRDEAKSYKQDMYGFQLGNIKALPNALAKTSAYNVDNKYFPFIEHYSATDVEIEAFKSKLKYNGMTIGVIGKFADYLANEETYVKGQLIRLEGIGDMHMVNQIAAEMEKGVYIDGSITEGV